jgi:hypothetical protein
MHLFKIIQVPISSFQSAHDEEKRQGQRRENVKYLECRPQPSA